MSARGLPWAAGLLGAAALLSGAAALALGLRPPAADRAMVGPPPALANSQVDVGGRRIHLRCGGSGSPTVILTGGAGAIAGSWRLVQLEVARRTRACSWDRAGFGSSDGSPAPQTAAETAADLFRALTAARIAGPLVLVGHSLGAYETLAFADAHPDRVAGMVLVDPSTPGMFGNMGGGNPAAAQGAARAMLAPYTRPLTACLQALEQNRAPPADLPIRCTRATSPAALRTALSFYHSAAASSQALVKPGRRYAAMPLVVLTAGPDPATIDAADAKQASIRRRAQAMQLAHAPLVRLSSAGVGRHVPDSGHMIQTQRPDAVIGAVAEVLEQLEGS